MSRLRSPPRTLLRAHVWLGTLATIPLLVIAGSGIVLGFLEPLRHAGPPHRLDRAVASPLAPARLLEAIQAAHPAHRIERLRLPSRPDAAAVATLSGPDRRAAFVHPGTGAVLETRPGEGGDWLDALRALHHGKALGAPGTYLASAAGIVASALWALGLRVRARLPARRPPPAGRRLRPRMLHLHRRLGAVAGALLSLLALTGAALNHVAPLRAWLLPEPRATGLPGDRAALARAVEAGIAAYPGAPLGRIDLPAGASAPLRLRFRDGGSVHVDGARGEVLRVASPRSHLLLALYPLHSGRAFGPLGPPAMAGLGLLSLGLVATGASFHARRRRRTGGAPAAPRSPSG